MIQLRKKEGTGTYYRREGRKVKAYRPGDVVEVASTKTMKCFMDGFEKIKEASSEEPKSAKKFKRKD